MSLAAPESRAIAVVRVPSPWWALGFVITSKFVDAIPEYAEAPGLTHKAFTLTDDRRFGGVYLWESRAAAERWFDAAWHERVRKKRGVDGDVRILDARWTVAGPATPTGRALPFHGLRTEAFVVWVTTAPGRAPLDRDDRLRALAAVHGVTSELVRVSFVSDDEGRVGCVSLFTDREAARAFWDEARLGRAAEALGAPLEVVGLAAPVLLDAEAARRDVVPR